MCFGTTGFASISDVILKFGENPKVDRFCPLLSVVRRLTIYFQCDINLFYLTYIMKLIHDYLHVPSSSFP